MKSTVWAELDPRSLAVFRILLGGFVFIDTLWRLPFLNEFMTDRGVLSREQMVSSPFADYWISFHLGSGNLTGQIVLSVILAALSIGMMIGWRTHLMTAGCWVMINSLHARNPFIDDRGDLQLSLMLFWAIFLPLGSQWSLDKKQGRSILGACRGVASAGLILQFAWIYLFAAFLKTGDFWLARGDGLKFSLLSPMFSTGIGASVSQWSDGTLRLLNYAVVAGELFVAFLLLSPILVSLCRRLAVVLLLIFHMVVLFVFHLGLFPWIGALTPLVLLPREFWERFKVKSSNQTEAERRPGVGIRVFLVICIVLSLLSNLSFRPEGSELEGLKPLAQLTRRLKLEQHWDLFAPQPPINGTFRLVSVTPKGEEIVLFQGPPSQQDQDLQPFPGHRWKMLMLATIYPEFAFLRESTARVLAKRAGGSQGGKLRYQFILNPVDERGSFRASGDPKPLGGTVNIQGGKLAAFWLLLFCLPALFILGSRLHRSYDSPPRIGQTFFAQRLALAGEFSGPLPANLDSSFKALALKLESNPAHRAILKNQTLSTLEVESTSEGYRLWSEHLSGPGSGAIYELRQRGYDSLMRLLVVFSMSVVLMLLPLVCLALFRRSLNESRAIFEAPPWTVVLTVFGAWSAVSSILARGLAVFWLPHTQPIHVVLASQALSYLVGAILFVLYWKWDDWRPWTNLDFKALSGGYFFLLLLLPATEFATHVLTGVDPHAQLSLLPYFRGLSNLQGAALVLIAVFVGPIFEELLFRGWLLLGLAPRLGNTKALLLSSLLFAAGHGNIWALPISFLFALVLGRIALRTGSLGTGICLHILWNATTLCWIYAAV